MVSPAVATTMQSTSAPGIFTCRGLSVRGSAMRSTCAITSPPELCAAIASDSVSTVSASRSMVMLPSGSAVVPRIDADVDRNRLVEEILLAADDHQLDQILGRSFVQLATAETRISESAEPDPRQMARLARGDIAIKVRDRPQRQVIAFDLVADHKPLERGDEIAMPPDDALDEAGLREALSPRPVKGCPCPTHENNVRSRGLPKARQLCVARLVNLADLVNDLLGEPDAAEPADRDRIAAANQPHCLARRDDLAGLARSRRWNDRRGAHSTTPLDLHCRSRGSLPLINAA